MPFSASKVIAGAIVGVLERRRALAQCLAIPFVASVVVEALYRPSIDSLGALLLYAPAIMALGSVIAINTHRHILLGPNSVPAWGLREWGRREWRFFGYCFAMGIIAIPMIPLIFIPFIGPLIALGVGCWVLVRLSLVFPSTALDHEAHLGDAWAMSAAHQWPLIVSVAIFPLGLGILDALVVMPIVGLSQSVALVSVVAATVSTLTSVFAIAALSLAYWEILRIGMPTESAGEDGQSQDH